MKVFFRIMASLLKTNEPKNFFKKNEKKIDDDVVKSVLDSLIILVEEPRAFT